MVGRNIGPLIAFMGFLTDLLGCVSAHRSSQVGRRKEFLRTSRAVGIAAPEARRILIPRLCSYIAVRLVRSDRVFELNHFID